MGPDGEGCCIPHDCDGKCPWAPWVTARLELCPVSPAEAKRHVNLYHEHNNAPAGWKFGTGVSCNGDLIGVAMVGHPTGRGLDQRLDVEVTRVCITIAGRYKNAASMLYGAACRMAAAGGYRDAYTYTLDEEDAASVKAAGFTLDAVLPARETWATASRPRYDENLFGETTRPAGPKCRWIRHLRTTRDSGALQDPSPGPLVQDRTTE